MSKKLLANHSPKKLVEKFLITSARSEKPERILIKKPGSYLIELAKPGARAIVEGFFETKKQQALEVNIVISHLVPHTRAQIELRGVVHDSSFIKFKGRIIIASNCPDTQSFLTERVLLIGENSRAETIPDLEIESDDVKCSHAASISTLDEEQIFYLMSRGISRKKATKMLVEGFLISQF